MHWTPLVRARLAYLLLLRCFCVQGLTSTRSFGSVAQRNDDRNYERIQSEYILLKGGARLQVLGGEASASVRTPVVVVIPGGGYGHLTIPQEGERVAEVYTRFGARSFVLEYRTRSQMNLSATEPLAPAPLMDVQAAVAAVRTLVAPGSPVALAGFSAGGHLALWAAVESSPDLRPDAIIMGYPVVSSRTDLGPQVCFDSLFGLNADEATLQGASLEYLVRGNTEVPPVFIWHTVDDQIVPFESASLLANSLSIPHELHLFPHGPHGLGVSQLLSDDVIGLDAKQWPNLSCKWLLSLGKEWSALDCTGWVWAA